MTERRDIGGSRARAAVHYAGHLLVARELRCTTKRLGKCVGVTSAMVEGGAFAVRGNIARPKTEAEPEVARARQARRTVEAAVLAGYAAEALRRGDLRRLPYQPNPTMPLDEKGDLLMAVGSVQVDTLRKGAVVAGVNRAYERARRILAKRANWAEVERLAEREHPRAPARRRPPPEDFRTLRGRLG